MRVYVLQSKGVSCKEGIMFKECINIYQPHKPPAQGAWQWCRCSMFATPRRGFISLETPSGGGRQERFEQNKYLSAGGTGGPFWGPRFEQRAYVYHGTYFMNFFASSAYLGFLTTFLNPIRVLKGCFLAVLLASQPGTEPPGFASMV